MGCILPWRNYNIPFGHKGSSKYCRWYFDQLLKRLFLQLDSNGITLNFMKLFKASLQCFFLRKVINRTDQSYRKLKKRTHQTLLSNLYQVIVHLHTLTLPLRDFWQKEVDFDWTGTCNEAFGKLKLCMNSDTHLSYFDESIYRVTLTPTPLHMGYLDNIFT